MSDKEKPEQMMEEHLEYLDVLRGTGITNMFGAGPYLKNAYPELSRKDANSILAYWMETFEERCIIERD
jgi:hypothetical protein